MAFDGGRMARMFRNISILVTILALALAASLAACGLGAAERGGKSSGAAEEQTAGIAPASGKDAGAGATAAGTYGKGAGDNFNVPIQGDAEPAAGDGPGEGGKEGETASVPVSGTDNARADFDKHMAYIEEQLEECIPYGSGNVMPPEIFQSVLEELEQIAKEYKFKSMDKDRLAKAYLKLASNCMKAANAKENVEIIGVCIKRAEELIADPSRSPFLYYAKGCLKQHEGNAAEAEKLIKKAAGIARSNRDIELWLKAYSSEFKRESRILKSISLSELGIDGTGFDTYMGTMWVDNRRILAAVFNSAGGTEKERLMLIDTVTLEYRKVYEGDFIWLNFATPDGKYAVLNDNGLKIVELETGKTTLISPRNCQCGLSPDGSAIAYADNGIWIYDIESKSKKKIDGGRDDASPIWFPDGKSILFAGDVGGEDLGAGFGHKQSIFSLRLEDGNTGREMIVPGWESKFHYIKWILPGMTVHVEEGWDDGFESIVLSLYDGEMKTLGSMERGEILYYNEGAYNLFTVDGNGAVSRLDPYGRLMAKYKYGDIWGDGFGIVLPHFAVLPSDDRVIFSYRTTLQEKPTLWLADINLESAEFITELPAESCGRFIISPDGEKVLADKGGGVLELFYIGAGGGNAYEGGNGNMGMDIGDGMDSNNSD